MCFVVFVTFKDAQGKVCTSIECCEKVFAMILIVLFYLIFLPIYQIIRYFYD